MNSTTVNPAELGWGEPESFTIFANVLMGTAVALIVVLNSFGLFALRRFSDVPDSTKMFMTSLTAADLCIGLFCALPNLVEVVHREWPLGDFLCRLWGIFYPAFLLLSILSLLFLTVDRFVAIVFALRYHDIMTPRRSKIAVAILWGITFLLGIVFFGILTPCTVSEETNYICDYTVRGIYQYFSINSLAVTLGTILVLYLYILHVARRQARRIAAQNQITGTTEAQNAPQRINTKSASTVLIITGSVVLSWTPTLTLLVLHTQQIYVSKSWSAIAKAVFFSNSWVNVVIYYCRKRELRQKVHRWVKSFFQ